MRGPGQGGLSQLGSTWRLACTKLGCVSIHVGKIVVERLLDCFPTVNGVDSQILTNFGTMDSLLIRIVSGKYLVDRLAKILILPPADDLSEALDRNPGPNNVHRGTPSIPVVVASPDPPFQGQSRKRK